MSSYAADGGLHPRLRSAPPLLMMWLQLLATPFGLLLIVPVVHFVKILVEDVRSTFVFGFFSVDRDAQASFF